MSQGLETNVANGSATINVSDPISLLTVNVGVTVAPVVNYDTASYTAGTGAGIGGSTGTPLVYDAAPDHPNDAHFRDILGVGALFDPTSPPQMSVLSDVSKLGTGGHTKYNFGVGFVDLIALDNTVTYLGTQTYKATVKGQNVGQSTPQPQMALNLPAGVHSVWVWGRKRYSTTFSSLGDPTSATGLGFNSGTNVLNVCQITQAVTANVSPQTVTVNSTATLWNGCSLTIDTGSGTEETLAPQTSFLKVLDGTHISAIFTQNHAINAQCDMMFGRGNAQSTGYKAGPHALTNNGRWSWEYSNGDGRTNGDWESIGIPGSPALAGTGVSSMGAALTTEFTSGDWIDYAFHAEQFIGGNGNIWVAVVGWERHQGDAHYTRTGIRRTADTLQNVFADIAAASVWPLNHNQARLSDENFWVWGNAVWDDTVTPDPFGILAYEATLAPEACTIGAVLAQDNSSATFPVSMGRFAGYVRPVVDGTEIIAQEYSIPRTQPDVAFSTNSTSGLTPYALPMDVMGLSAGTHTISFNIYNGNKTAHVNTGDGSVTIVNTPGTPSVGTIFGVSATSLFVPVTFGSGSAPLTLPWQYSTDGGATWTSGTAIPVAGAASSATRIVEFLIPSSSPSTSYTIKVAATNGSGTSSYSSNVSGTTAAATTLDVGFDFRDMTAGVTDPTGSYAVTTTNAGTVSPQAYPTTIGGMNVGTVAPFSGTDNGRVRTPSGGRLAGMWFQSNNGTRPNWEIDVTAGTKVAVYIGACDDTGGLASQNHEVKDNTTSIQAVVGAACASGHAIDANGNVFTDVNWYVQQQPVVFTCTSGKINMLWGSTGSASGISALSHARVVELT